MIASVVAARESRAQLSGSVVRCGCGACFAPGAKPSKCRTCGAQHEPWKWSRAARLELIRELEFFAGAPEGSAYRVCSEWHPAGKPIVRWFFDHSPAVGDVERNDWWVMRAIENSAFWESP